MGSDLIDLTFDEWVKHVFDHPVAEPWHFDVEADWWNGPRETTAAYLTQLFESPEFLIDEYSAPQLEQGLWYLNQTGGPFMSSVLDPGVPWELRLRCIHSMYTLFERFFARACSDTLGHLATQAVPINIACYMWWDLFPSFGNPDDPTKAEEDSAVLHVMRRILDIHSEACRESALHGLGHWHTSYPELVEQIVDDFLAAKPKISNALSEYAADARSGTVL